VLTYQDGTMAHYHQM